MLNKTMHIEKLKTTHNLERSMSKYPSAYNELQGSKQNWISHQINIFLKPREHKSYEIHPNSKCSLIEKGNREEK